MAFINHHEQGNGNTIILIHGFPLNQEIWKDFAEKLSKRLHVVTIDLPGFGKTPSLPIGFLIEDVALLILAWIREKKFNKPIITGHSLGGYVSLAMSELEINSIAGMCLFHSTAFADSEEKKQSRNKVLEFIEKKGVEAYTSNFIGQLYANPQHSSITKVKKIAVQSSENTVTGYLKAMRDRKDRSDLLRRFPSPMLFLGGAKDKIIPIESIHQQVKLNPKAEAFILPEAAHMGMFESEDTSLNQIEKFVEKCAVTF